MRTTAPQTLRQAWVALAGLAAVFLFEMLDNSILNVALPTIGRDLHASTVDLQWVTNSYSVVFGGLMLALGAVADRFGRRRVMVVGLVMLALASLATAFVTTSGELIAVRIVMGIAAAMTTPGSIALAFRLFDAEGLRVRAINIISTVGLIGLAIGPTAGGFVLAVAPWQVLLLINVPIALIALVGIVRGIAADKPEDLHRDPADIPGAILGTLTIVLALVAPTLFVQSGAGSWQPWTATVAAVVAGVLFVVRQRTARHPLLDLALVARPLVASGLAYKAASGLAVAGMGYLVTLQLQLDWGWTPALAAIGMLPQVVVLVAGGAFVSKFIAWAGIARAAWMSAGSVVLGLAVYATLSNLGYVFVAISLVLVAAGMRVVGVVAGFNVLKGLPENRTSIGAALVDTASEVTSAVGVAVTGTILAALFTGSIATGHWSAVQTGQFRDAIMLAGGILTVVSAALVGWAFLRSRGAVAEAVAADAAEAAEREPAAA
jgi:MFS family permease